MSEVMIYFSLSQGAANTLHEMLHIGFVQLAKNAANPLELKPYVEIIDILDDAMKKFPSIILISTPGDNPDA